MPIQILDPVVAAQIAAGEVVERPASIARELIENALDAGARRITVEVRGGGLAELRVQDDGRGILASEVEIAFMRHATSKLISADDLWALTTLGFRGEALPSIAAVAQVVCVTHAVGEELGTELRIAGGEIQARSAVGAPLGTSISIRNLFYNTPVRREFLRSEGSESAAVMATLSQYALAYPEVRFTLVLDGRTVVQTSGDGDLRGVIIELYGLEIARQLLPVELTQGERQAHISVRGCISPPGVTRSSRSGLHLFINRRVVAPRGALAAVIEEAYHTLLMKGRHPFVVLNITVDPAAVDVNIHPMKSEVKFRDAPRVLSVLGRAVRDALLASGVPLWEANSSPDIEVQRRFELRRMDAPSDSSSGEGQITSLDHTLFGSTFGFEEEHRPSGSVPSEATEQSYELWVGSKTHSAANLRILGQAAHAYLVADSPSGIVLVDQHAAHERVLYERLQVQWAQGQLAAQQIEPALTITLAGDLHEQLLHHQELLATWGFAIDDFGMALRVRSLPAGLATERAAAILTEIATQLGHGTSSNPAAWEPALLASLACHSAVRAGQALSHAEMHALLQDLARCQTPHTCPHGRPTMVVLGYGQVEREFGRHG